jgi:hypothetical protein
MFLRYFPGLFTKPGNLDLLVNNIRKNNPDQRQKLQLEAYNAYILLKHFDDFVIKRFEKLVEINPNTKQFHPMRYVLKNEGSKLFTTWRTTDEIWLNKEINNIV